MRQSQFLSTVSHLRRVRNDSSLCSLHGVQKLCEKGLLSEVLRVVDVMEKNGICIPEDIFFSVLGECIRNKNLAAGREVSLLITRCGYESNTFLGTHLIRMFTLCGSLLEAREVFNKLPKQSEFTWSAIIAAHAKLGNEVEALNLYHKMYTAGAKPDGHVFVAVLKACCNTSALENGKFIHAHIVENGSDTNLFVGNTLIDMYAKGGSLEDAHRLFEKLLKPDLVTWSAMITGYAQHGHGQEALRLFQMMRQEGMEPDNVILVSILKACSCIESLNQGKVIHNLIRESGFESHAFIQSALIDMYTKCGCLKCAHKVFNKMSKPCLVTWNTIITGYAQHVHGHDDPLKLYKEMKRNGIEPDLVTYLSLVKACSNLRALDKARYVHACIIEDGHASNVQIGNTLIDMYAKCWNLEDACKVFDHMSNRTLVTWNAMIAAYTLHGHGQEALQLYQHMQQGNMEPDNVTCVFLLKACSSVVALNQGKCIHDNIIEHCCESDIVGNSLVDMYAKCGSLEDACMVFDKLPKRDVVTWTAIIEGFAHHNNHKLALQYFKDMQQQGVKPNDVTFVSLLSICSRVGLLHEGCCHFELMREAYGISPALDHYNCMVDLLCHAGHLNEAEGLLYTMPFKWNPVGWMCLLSHCKSQSNVAAARKCFKHVVTMDSTKASGYTIMSHIFADAGLDGDVDKVQELRKCAYVWKKPGKAYIEVDNQVHDFVVGDETHPQSDGMYTNLKKLHMHMKVDGYVPTWEPMQLSMLNEDNAAVLG